MGSTERAEGRARVRALLWDRLDAAGITRCKRQSVDDHAAMRSRLTDRLDHMSAENLITLAESIIDVAAARRSENCPTEVLIRGLANGLQQRPVTQHEIVTSWLASVEGPPALAGGYAVTLYRWLLRHAPPGPTPYSMGQIRARAEDDMRMVEIYRERLARNTITDDDRKALAAWERDTETVRQIIAQGVASRAAKAQEAAA